MSTPGNDDETNITHEGFNVTLTKPVTISPVLTSASDVLEDIGCTIVYSGF